MMLRCHPDFPFLYVKSCYYENDDWFTGCYGNEEFKTAIRGNSTDGMDVLIFTLAVHHMVFLGIPTYLLQVTMLCLSCRTV
jgi:hypothetical protein